MNFFSPCNNQKAYGFKKTFQKNNHQKSLYGILIISERVKFN